jgi:hypothetical protein
MFRKRYTVVIIGGSGASAAQRSEISRHRSEREALLAAQYERERLGGLHGDGTGKYRVVVEREGEIISTGPVADLAGLPSEITHGHPDDELDLQLGDSPTDPGRLHAVLHRDEPADPDAPAGTPAPTSVPLPDAAATNGERPPRPPIDDDIPEGPVPDDVLRRFEESLQREEERRTRNLPRDEE